MHLVNLGIITELAIKQLQLHAHLHDDGPNVDLLPRRRSWVLNDVGAGHELLAHLVRQRYILAVVGMLGLARELADEYVSMWHMTCPFLMEGTRRLYRSRC